LLFASKAVGRLELPCYSLNLSVLINIILDKREHHILVTNIVKDTFGNADV